MVNPLNNITRNEFKTLLKDGGSIRTALNKYNFYINENVSIEYIIKKVFENNLQCLFQNLGHCTHIS